MSHLAPCPACNRHVAVDEIACPFCAAPLPDAFRGLQPPPPARGRLSRAAMFTAGATLLGAAACSDDAMPMPLYGAPFDGSITGDASGGAGGSNAAGGAGGTAAGGSGGTAAGGSGGTAAGGAAGTASSDAGSDRGAVALYGAAPIDATVGPAYGIPADTSLNNKT